MVRLRSVCQGSETLLLALEARTFPAETHESDLNEGGPPARAARSSSLLVLPHAASSLPDSPGEAEWAALWPSSRPR